MHVQRYDDTEYLKESATTKDIAEALENPHNRSISVHREGDVFKMGGSHYRVGAGGKITPISITSRDRRKEKHKAARRARKKNRR